MIDAMLERIKHEKTVDIYGHVTLMRAQRNYMVQTEDQYVFIHDALQEAVNCGTTEVPARNLYAYIQKLTQIEGGENVTGMELEFKVQTENTTVKCPLISILESIFISYIGVNTQTSRQPVVSFLFDIISLRNEMTYDKHPPFLSSSLLPLFGEAMVLVCIKISGFWRVFT